MRSGVFQSKLSLLRQIVHNRVAESGHESVTANCVADVPHVFKVKSPAIVQGQWERRGKVCAALRRSGLVPEEVTRYRSFGGKDTTSRVMMEGILVNEEEHADEMADLLFAVQPGTNQGSRRLYFSDETLGRAERDPVRS